MILNLLEIQFLEKIGFLKPSFDDKTQIFYNVQYLVDKKKFLKK